MRPDHEVHSALPVDPTCEPLAVTLRLGGVSVAFARKGILDFLEQCESSNWVVVGSIRLARPEESCEQPATHTGSIEAGAPALAEAIHHQGEPVLRDGGLARDNGLPGSLGRPGHVVIT